MNKMKKNFLMFVALVAATLGFTACSSEDDLANAEQEARRVVKTEFTISIPQRTSGVTRMTTATVQGQMSGNAQNPTFRGIQDIFLYPLPGNATYLKTTAGASATNLPKAVTLFKGTSANGWDGPSSNTSNNMIDAPTSTYSSLNSSSSHLYKDVEIPIGTSSLMFYGEALRTTSSTDFQNGAIKKNLDECARTEESGENVAFATYCPRPRQGVNTNVKTSERIRKKNLQKESAKRIRKKIRKKNL